MPLITAIEPQKRNPDRLNIYLDGEFAFGLNRLTAAWLKVGQNLTPEKAKALQESDALETAYQRALFFMSFRPRSLDEVRQKLKKLEIPEAAIETTLARLQEEGLANDERFARMWVENRGTFRPRSHRLLQMEMRQKGLPEESIQAALSTSPSDEELALEAGRKKAWQLANLPRLDFRRKLQGFLARRGFSYPVIAEVSEILWQETNPGEDPNDTNEDYNYD
jgi:regulatory protein